MITPLMSWIKGRHCWYKKYQGQLYQISCRQLNCPSTKEQSVLAANNWWERKQAEIDAAEQAARDTPEVVAERLTLDTLNSLDADELRALILKGGTASGLLVLKSAVEDGLKLNSSFCLSGHVQAEASVVSAPVPQDRNLKAQSGQWLEALRLSAQQGLIHEGRWDSYRRHAKIFCRWLGEDKPVEAVTAAKLDEYWAWLSFQIAETL